MESEFYTYIIQSEKHGRYYVGMSSNPDKRLHFHNLGLNKSTRGGMPWGKVWLSVPMEKAEAMQLEKKIKKRGAARFIGDLQAR